MKRIKQQLQQKKRKKRVLDKRYRITSYNVCYTKLLRKAMGFIDASTDVQTQSEMYSTETSNSQSDDTESTTTEDAVQDTSEEIADIVQQMNRNNFV